ncbi:MAG: aspartate carbamoyltransferase catalytic subunit [Methylacidiphilales bacterium]|nr:aspartate carbamoyltransferase catalytic subunit [Candidatus Methylacidiphilales bacterium]MDW8349771.1 aspartate carbamoyltransferase catalytic subunit [Verrucomicrobiae bacterium]
MNPWPHKDLVSIRQLTRDQFDYLLQTARSFKEILSRPIKKVPSLRGKTVVNLFVEPSTRTRLSFELAATRLSADVLNLDSDTSSFKKGESLLDTARNLQSMGADIIILRHNAAGSADFLARRLPAHIINAGDGAHEHPTQAILDVFTIRERLGSLENKRVLIVGDILHSRVARSNIYALKLYGADITLVGPPTLVPRVFESLGVRVAHELDAHLPTADVIYLLRIQHERQRATYFPGVNDYVYLYGLTPARLGLCKPTAIIMHPGPMNRGVEIHSDIADSPQSTILEQVNNGLAVRMAVLYALAAGTAQMAFPTA